MICETKSELLSKKWDYEPNVYKASYMGRDVFVTAMTAKSAASQSNKHFSKLTKKKINEDKVFVEIIGKVELVPKLKEF